MSKKRKSLTKTTKLASPGNQYMRATAERKQHTEIEEINPDSSTPHIRAQRTRTAADGLLKSHRIGQAEYDAATRYRDDFEFALYGYSAPGVQGSGGDIIDFMNVKVATANRLRLADQALGAERRPLLEAFMIHAMTYSAVLEQQGKGINGRNVDALKTEFSGILEHLAMHYSGELYLPKYVPVISHHSDYEKPETQSDEDFKDAVMDSLQQLSGYGFSSQRIVDQLKMRFGKRVDGVLEAL